VLASAILRTMRGESTISPEMTGQAGQRLPGLAEPAWRRDTPRGGRPGAQPVTTRTQILAEIARGASNKEIARTLDIAEATVKIHVQHILRKLNLSSRVQAAVYGRPGITCARPWRIAAVPFFCGG
jgi:two-component system nitrate/nitrite response regulator NarL